MTIHHLAIWTFRLEELKTFYTTYFKGKSNEKYINPQKGFESYFISFNFSFDSKEEVLQTTELLRTKGYIIASEPRTSGDGYFESVILDPDGNRIECVYK